MKILTLLLLSLFVVTYPAIAADSYIVNNGTSQTINEHGVCKNIANATGSSIMVPTKTANEWSTGGNSFITNPPAGITISDACCGGGASVGGYCWYLGTSNTESCNDICASHGGCNLVGTRDYAGSGGTDANCTAVMTALGAAGSFNTSVGGFALGCYTSNFNLWARGTDPTTCEDKGSNYFDPLGGSIYRACACNN